MQFKRHFLFLGLVSAAIAVNSESSRAAAPIPELTRLVGDDAVVCLEAQDLRHHWPRLIGSPLARRLEQAWFYREWREGDDFAKLQRARAAVEKQTGKPFGKFAADLFGHAVVFALYPTDDGGDPDGVVLTRAVNAEVLQAALAAWNREPQVQPVALQHAETTYFRRTKPRNDKGGAETLYYAAFEAVLALSDNESLIQDVIELQSSDDRGSLQASETYQRARSSLREETVVSLYFNPRALDEEIERKAPTTPAARLLADAWRRIESVAVGIAWDGGVNGEGVVHLQDKEQPAGFGQALERFAARPEFLQRVPDRALVVYAGHHDLAGLFRLMIQLTPENKREKWTTFRQVSRGLLLGLDLIDDVLPQLGSNWGVYFVPRSRLEADAFPADALAAIELPPPDPLQDGSAPTLRAALSNGLNTGFNLLAAFHNSKSPDSVAVVRSKSIAVDDSQKETVVRWIDGLGLYRPAYALTDDAMVFASTPELVEEYIRGSAPGRLVDRPDFQRWQAQSFAEAHQLAFVHLGHVRRFLTQNREYFVAEMVRKEKLTEADAETRFRRLIDVLQLFDSTYFAARLEETHFRLNAGGIADRPPAK